MIKTIMLYVGSAKDTYQGCLLLHHFEGFATLDEALKSITTAFLECYVDDACMFDEDMPVERLTSRNICNAVIYFVRSNCDAIAVLSGYADGWTYGNDVFLRSDCFDTTYFNLFENPGEVVIISENGEYLCEAAYKDMSLAVDDFEHYRISVKRNVFMLDQSEVPLKNCTETK